MRAKSLERATFIRRVNALPAEPAAVAQRRAKVAQLVEHAPEKCGVAGSIPALGTISYEGLAVGGSLVMFRALAS